MDYYLIDKFNTLVKDTFTFLIKCNGFLIVKETKMNVCYKGNGVLINIFLSPYPYSIEVEVEMSLAAKQKYSLYEIISVVSPSNKDKAIQQPSNERSMENGLKEISDLITNYCNDILDGKVASFDQLVIEIDKNRTIYTEKYQYGAIKDKAEKEWSSKNYKKAFEIYDSIKDHLTDKEKKRWEYLKNKVTPL